MLQLRKEIKKIQGELNFFPDEEKQEKFLIYLNYLLEYNKKINLTSFNKIEDFLRHNSFDFFPLLEKNFCNLFIDIGAGAGFLTVPLSIFNEDLKIIALEPNKKRGFFLNMIRYKLNLKFEIWEKRLEESIKFFPKEPLSFLVKALPKKEKILPFLSSKWKYPHNLFYFAGKNYKDLINNLKICYSFKEMIKIPLRDDSFILIFENVSCETWEKL